jgi:hypothetical protein
MNSGSVMISFPGVSIADANKLASSLAGHLRDLDQNVQVEQLKQRADTQDWGSVLSITLSSTSAAAIAAGIAGWLKRQSGAKIQISREGEVLASNLDSRDAARIAQAFSPHK